MARKLYQYNLLEDLGRSDVGKTTGICLFVFIVSLGFIIGGFFEPWPFIFIGSMFLIQVIPLFFLSPNPFLYLKIKKLYFDGYEKELITIAKKVNPRSILALYALFDLRSSEAKPLLQRYLRWGNTQKQAATLAAKVESLNLELKTSEETILQESSKPQFAIPITKTYFVDSAKELGKCMISKMQIQVENVVAVCPYCGNMAKKVLLDKWLKEKDTCPVCLTQMTIDDCPIVDIRDH